MKENSWARLAKMALGKGILGVAFFALLLFQANSASANFSRSLSDSELDKVYASGLRFNWSTSVKWNVGGKFKFNFNARGSVKARNDKFASKVSLLGGVFDVKVGGNAGGGSSGPSSQTINTPAGSIKFSTSITDTNKNTNTNTNTNTGNTAPPTSITTNGATTTIETSAPGGKVSVSFNGGTTPGSAPNNTVTTFLGANIDASMAVNISVVKGIGGARAPHLTRTVQRAIRSSVCPGCP